jgi:hypothetical protein
MRFQSKSPNSERDTPLHDLPAIKKARHSQQGFTDLERLRCNLLGLATRNSEPYCLARKSVAIATSWSCECFLGARRVRREVHVCSFSPGVFRLKTRRHRRVAAGPFSGVPE